MTHMTVGQAVDDCGTALGRAAALTSQDRALRLIRARQIMTDERVTLEEALRRVWEGVVWEGEVG